MSRFPITSTIAIILFIIVICILIFGEKGITDAEYTKIYQNAFNEANKECQQRRLTFEAIQPTSHDTFKAICITTSPYRKIEVDIKS